MKSYLRYLFCYILIVYGVRGHGQGHRWTGHLVFKDDFTGDQLRTDLWDHDDNCEGKNEGSQTLECFQRGKNLVVENGTLVVRARTDILDERKGTMYTSAKIRTRGYGFSYGTYVVRARMPKGKHLLPSFWIQPMDQDVNKCRYEEVNVAEVRGQRSSTLIVSAAYGRNYSSANVRTYERVFQRADFSADFHEFTLRWLPTRLQWFLDGTKIYELTTHYLTDWQDEKTEMRPCDEGDSALFSKDSNFLISLGVGGIKFPAWKYGNLTRAEAAKWPKPTLEVDYVHIYQD